MSADGSRQTELEAQGFKVSQVSRFRGLETWKRETLKLAVLPLSRSKGGVDYLVRSLRTYARIRSLTTGTFNQIFKDRITIRLSGANSVRPDSNESDRPRNPLTILRCEKACQSRHPTEFPPDFHSGTLMWGQSPSAVRSSEARQRSHASAQQYDLPPVGNPEWRSPYEGSTPWAHAFSDARKRKTEN